MVEGRTTLRGSDRVGGIFRVRSGPAEVGKAGIARALDPDVGRLAASGMDPNGKRDQGRADSHAGHIRLVQKAVLALGWLGAPEHTAGGVVPRAGVLHGAFVDGQA
jgi:hypothetical protein